MEIGRYVILGDIAHGGMATVHLGRLRGAAGFERTVAVKRLHPAYARDPDFVAMFTDEARLASRIQHPNVVSTLDVISRDDELFLVLEYIHGETLGQLLERQAGPLPPEIASAVIVGALEGLHAAHEATDSRGEPLHLVHRDVSPQNVLLGADGVPRVLDFGVAKAAGRVHTTQDGFVKGKLAYMPPEQLYGERLDRRADIYAAAVVFWELLTGERLFAKHDAQPALLKVIDPVEHAPSLRADVPAELDEIVLGALAEAPADRPATALELARAIRGVVRPASWVEVGEWVRALAAESLEARANRLSELEGTIGDSAPDSAPFTGLTAAPTAITPVPSSGSFTGVVTTAAPQPSERHPRRWRWAAVAALLSLGGLAAAMTLARVGGDASRALSAPASVSESAVEPEAVAVTREPSRSEAHHAEKPASPAPSAEPAEVATSDFVSKRSEPATTVRPRPAPVAAPRKDCSKPYVIDAKGHKRYKKECF